MQIAGKEGSGGRSRRRMRRSNSPAPWTIPQIYEENRGGEG
jgi:hypothetical protein